MSKSHWLQTNGWLIVLFGGMAIILITVITFSNYYQEKETNFINDYFSCELSSSMLESVEYQSNKELIIKKTFAECLE